jgi:hypothetical protein
VLTRSLFLINLVSFSIRSHCVEESHTQVCLGSLDFHQEVPNLVPRAVGTVCRADSAFEVIDNSDQNLAQFVKLRVFCRCDQLLVPWPRSNEAKLP